MLEMQYPFDREAIAVFIRPRYTLADELTMCGSLFELKDGIHDLGIVDHASQSVSFHASSTLTCL
jgi:hypothetical protein